MTMLMPGSKLRPEDVTNKYVLALLEVRKKKAARK